MAPEPLLLRITIFKPFTTSQSMSQPSEMDRLRNLAARSSDRLRVECRFRIPKSLSTTSLMLHKTTELDEGSEDTRSTLSSTSDSAVLQPMTSLYSEPTSRPSLSSSDTKTTSAQSRAQQGISTTGKQTSSNKKNKTKLRKMDRNAETQAALKGNDPSVSVAGRKADQELFDQVLTSIAQTDVIANSGHELYRRVNDCARDYMEAKQIVERREHEIAAISTKIESMQATIDNASKHLHKAQSIAAEAIDSSVSEQYRLREQDNLTNILIGMTDAIAKGDCHIWTREKVNQCLEDLQWVYLKNKYYCQSPMVSSGILHVAKHFVFHADYDDAFEPMLFHLVNQTNYKGFVERSGRQDHEFAKQHHAACRYPTSDAPNPNTGTAPLNEDVPMDKAEGSYLDAAFAASVAAAVAAPFEGPDGAAEAAKAGPDASKQEPLQKLTKLPPRSSSLPSSARKMPAKNPGQPNFQQTLGDALFSEPCGNAAYTYKHLEFKPNAELKQLADEVCSKMEPPHGMTSRVMGAAVLESIAGVEAIFKDGMVGASPDIKRDVAAAVNSMKRLHKDYVNSGQVARNLSAAAETNDSSSILPRDVSVSSGRVRVEVTTAGAFQDCVCKGARQDGPESKFTDEDKATHNGDDMAGSGEDLDLLWKAYTSRIAPAKR